MAEKWQARAGRICRAVVEAALETGMRRGEILSLQWSQIEGLKSRRRRLNPDRRRGLGAARRDRPAVDENEDAARAPHSDLVAPAERFSKCAGSIPPARRSPPTRSSSATRSASGCSDMKRAWKTAVLKAHGHTPAFTRRRT